VTNLSLPVIANDFLGYTPAMTIPMQDLIGDLEIRIIATVDQLRGAALDFEYAKVVDLEQRLDRLYDTLGLVTQGATEGVASW